MSQRAASKNVWFSQWNLTILTCLVMLGSCRCSSAMISKVLSAFVFSMSMATYTVISTVWRPRVSEITVCVTFGALLRWAPVSLWVATLHGHGETLPMSNPLRFPLFQRAASRNVWFSQWILTILTCLVMLGSCRCSSAMISTVLSAFVISMSMAEYTVISTVWRPRVSEITVCVTFGALRRLAPWSISTRAVVDHGSILPTMNLLRFPLFQCAASKNVWFSHWNLAILTSLVMLESCRCSSAMISTVWGAFVFAMFMADSTMISTVWRPPCL